MDDMAVDIISRINTDEKKDGDDKQSSLVSCDGSSSGSDSNRRYINHLYDCNIHWETRSENKRCREGWKDLLFYFVDDEGRYDEDNDDTDGNDNDDKDHGGRRVYKAPPRQNKCPEKACKEKK